MDNWVEVRWGFREDEARVAELLELNGVPRWAAFEERYIVAEEKGRCWRRSVTGRRPGSSFWGFSS
jgi:hypothetical protein